ncbi:MAG: hypothetical protein AAB414_00055 [Patescibacteria group bacterium]
MGKRLGKLLAFEGVDGSGKTTQINLLSKILKQKGKAFEVISFPQYGKNEYADYIYDYLSGKFGDINDVEVHELAKKYADDRKTAKDLITGWLENGKLVIANRYISSSKAHLGAHLDGNKGKEFIKWVDDLEYKENKMPREDLTILLNVDSKVGQKNSQDKNHPDIHEDNLAHLERANKIFLELAKENPSWYVIGCMQNGQMRTRENIHLEILKIVKT